MRSNMEMQNFYSNQMQKRQQSAMENSYKHTMLKHRLQELKYDDRKWKLFLHYKWAILKETKWQLYNEAVDRREKNLRMIQWAKSVSVTTVLRQIMIAYLHHKADVE